MQLGRDRYFGLASLVFAMVGLGVDRADAQVPGARPLSTTEQIDFLQQQIDQLRAQNVGVKSEVPMWYSSASDAPIPTVPQSAAPFATATPPSVFEQGPPPAAPEKKYPDFKLTGVFQIDAARFGQSDESIATLGDIEDGLGFRRARFAATGNVTERTSYIMEFDLAQSQARFVDVWGQVKETPLGNMRIGRYRQPFGMSELTSIRELPFLERPTIFALGPFRQTGIMFSNTALGDSATWAVSGFRSLSDNFGNVYGDDGGYGTAERFTFLAMDRGDDCGIVHFGFAHSYLDPARNQLQFASQDEVFLSQQPNLGPTGLSVLPIVNVPPFVNSGVFDVSHVNHYNVEAAASVGRALIQSEYRWSNLELASGDNTTVHGGYATIRYMLTGEVIPYNRAGGVFGRVKPNTPLDIAKGHWGAWEIAARYTTINLNPMFGLPGVPGPTRRLDSTDLGLNWYWTSNSKCQMEWINGSLADPTLGKSITNTLAGRVQFDF